VDRLISCSQVSVAHTQRSAQLCNAERGLKVGQDHSLGLLDQMTPSCMCGAHKAPRLKIEGDYDRTFAPDRLRAPSMAKATLFALALG
jgi:hypothetical protein